MAKILFDGVEYSKLYFDSTIEIKTINFTDSSGQITAVPLECAHGDWVKTTVTPASCTSAGRVRYTCGYCDYYYEEFTNKTAHKYVAGKCKYCGQEAIGGGGITPVG